MQKLEFTRQIAASTADVWNALWSDTTYPEWTKPFSPMSRAESTWEEGSEIRFVDDKGSGMFCIIKKKVPNEYMSFVIEGMVSDGEVVPGGGEVDKWKGGEENYSLKENEGGTELYVELTSSAMDAGMLDFFKSAWPKALDKLEEIATR